jgi:uncharacterized protein YciI
MPYFVLIYHVGENYIERRTPFRQEHLRLARQSYERGEMVMGGAFADPADKGLLIFRGADRGVAEKFAKNDPYVLNGLVATWEVRPWTVVIGGAE